MAEIATLARPYAEAAFRLGRETGTLAAWSGQLARLAIAADEAAGLIGNPKVTADQLEDIFSAAGGDGYSGEVANFVRLLASNGRLGCLSEIAVQFEAMKQGVEGVKEAVIHSAFPLGAAQVDDLRALLEKRFQSRLQVTVVDAPELIGGIRAVVGDQVLDTSVRSKLDAMRVALNS